MSDKPNPVHADSYLIRDRGRRLSDYPQLELLSDHDDGPLSGPRKWTFHAMRISVTAVVMILAVTPLANAAPAQGIHGQAQPEDIAAKVNGEVLTWRSVREGLQGIKPDQVTPELLHAKRRELAESILIRQFALRHQLAIPTTEVDEAVERERKKFASREEYQKFILIQHGSTTNYRRSLEWGLLRAKAMDHTMATQGSDPELKDARFTPATIPEAELRKYFEEHRDQFKPVEQVSFIRIGLSIRSGRSEVEARTILESLLRRIEKGTEIAMLAYFWSDVPRAKAFRDRGVTRNDLDGIYAPETIAYLFNTMKEGETSEILRDGSTLNIFRMVSKVKYGAETFEEARGPIRSMMEARVRESNDRTFVNALLASAKIEPFDVFEEK